MKLWILLPLLLCGCAQFTTVTEYNRNTQTSKTTQKSLVIFGDKLTVLRYNLSQNGDLTNLQALIQQEVDAKMNAVIK